MSPYRFYTNNSIVAFSSCHSQIAYPFNKIYSD